MRLSKKLAAIAITAGVALTTTAAFSYWTSSGSGAGSASTGDASTWAVTSDAATPALTPLTPGGPSNSIAFHVKNNSSGYQKLQSVDISVAGTETVTGDATVWTTGEVSGACTKDDFSVGGELSGVSHIVLPAIDLAPGDTYDGSVSLQMLDGTSNQDNCKNVTVPLYFAAS